MRGGWGRKAARCGLPRFLRLAAFLAAFGPLATLAGVGRWGVGGMPRFATCRVSCGLWAARNACVGGVRWGVGGMPRFATCRVSCGLWAARNACGKGRWGVGGMPRFATCRVSCGLWAARNACFFVLRHRDLGRCPKPRQGDDPPAPRSFPLHPTLPPLHPYLTTRFLSLRKSSVTPSGGSPNVALSVLLPPSHVSCIAISLASIRQPSSATVTTSPTS